MYEVVVLCKYGELSLKRGNRYLFERKIIENIREILDPFGDYYVVKEQGRLVVERNNEPLDADFVISKIKNILGISYICPCVRIKSKDFEDIKKVGLEVFEKRLTSADKTFRVSTKRSDKDYPLDSMQISREMGAFILQNKPDLKVDLEKADINLNIEIRMEVYIYTDFIKGIGGLPQGSSGKGHVLLSGGIDSPVAFYMMARRGIDLKGVYFHSSPYTSEKAKEKVVDLLKVLSKYCGEISLDIVDFTEMQLYLNENVPKSKITIFLKRAMIRIAEEIAIKDGGICLVTGDSVGQVASQTLQALNATNTAAKTMPILRPLAGFDKQDIVDMAEKIGTYEISIRPYPDCCTIFVPEKPDLKPKTSVVEAIEKDLYQYRYEEIMQEAIDTVENILIDIRQN